MKYLSLEDKNEKIIEYCLQEFGSYPDYSNIKNIPLAYTTDGNDKEIQVSIDIENNILIIEYDLFIQYIPVTNYFYLDITFDDLVSMCKYSI